jgi:hypothetical protein
MVQTDRTDLLFYVSFYRFGLIIFVMYLKISFISFLGILTIFFNVLKNQLFVFLRFI